MNYLIVYLGGGLGATLRYAFNVLGASVMITNAPIATLTINVIGCLLMGFIAGCFAFRGNISQNFRLFIMTGIMGGFTTYSAFSLEVVSMFIRGQYYSASLYALITLIISIGATFIGINLIRVFSR
jgi:CrcB protein